MGCSASMDVPKQKLSYFNGRGRCEHIRYLYAAGGVSFEDYRLKDGEWPKLKEETPYGGLPILDVDGKRLGQSIAIGRYVARMTNMYGSTPLEGAVIDSIVDSVTELREEVATKVAFQKDEELKAKNTEEALKKAHTIFDNLAKILAANKASSSQYFVGKKLSWADIHFMAVLELTESLGQMTTVLDKHPTLKSLYNRVRENPRIKKYIAERPTTPF